MKLILVLLALTLVTGFLIFSLGGIVVANGMYANGLLPAVPVPADNPMTDSKIRLGAQLYFEGRLSSDGTISCASCHDPKKAWADAGPVSEGVGHQKGGRNSPSIIDSAYVVPQFWDGRALHLEKQAVGPVQNPIEMDLTEAQLNYRLNQIPGYVTQFREVFGAEPNIELMAKAIAAFERTVITLESPYDRYLRGDHMALSKSAMHGMEIFSGKGHCSVCHSGPAFSDSQFHNLGVGYSKGKFKDVGRYNVTKDPKDMGAFLTQRLRAVDLTRPYMHDGSEPTLQSVIELYNRGGVPNPNLDHTMVPLNLTKSEKKDLIAFLHALTGPYPMTEPPALPNPEITAQQLSTMMKEGAK